MDILKDKNVLITGSSSGIGKAIALLFASEGANVILCSNKSVSDGESVLSEVISMGSRATYYSADLQSEDEIKDLFKKIEDKYASIDILINNAGRTFNTDFKSVSEQTLLRDIKTNLLSSMLCSKYAIELMTSAYGWIVNTYCAATTGINSFTKTLASELAPRIFVNAVAPGFVDTGYMDTMDNSVKEAWLNNIPIKRFITPAEIAQVYLLLATSKIFTGSIVVPDGGYSLLGR